MPATAKAPKVPKHVWTDVLLFAQSKDPDGKPWRVQRNEEGRLRCSCPAFIFGKGPRHARTVEPQTTCKHIEYVLAHADEDAKAKAVAAFAEPLRAAFIATVNEARRAGGYRFQPITTYEDALKYANDLLFASGSRPWWHVFAERVMAIAQVPVETPTMHTIKGVEMPGLGKRRIILPGD